MRAKLKMMVALTSAGEEEGVRRRDEERVLMGGGRKRERWKIARDRLATVQGPRRCSRESMSLPGLGRPHRKLGLGPPGPRGRTGTLEPWRRLSVAMALWAEKMKERVMWGGILGYR